MAFDISKFSAHLNKYGTIKNNRYEVIISPPASFRLAPGFQEEFKEMFDILTLRVEQIRIPNVNLNVQRVNRYGIGPRQAFPTNAEFPETVSLTFLETENSDVHKFFHVWMNSIFGYYNTSFANERGIYLAEYKNIYSTLMTIKVYDDKGIDYVSNEVELTEAYPVQISEVPLSWGDNNTHMKINVNFAFTDIRFPQLNPNAFNFTPPT